MFRPTRPVGDERAAQAVRSKHHRKAASGYCRVERGHPVTAAGSRPVLLENPTAIGALALPVRLPVLRTRVPQARDQEDVGHPKLSLTAKMRFVFQSTRGISYSAHGAYRAAAVTSRQSWCQTRTLTNRRSTRTSDSVLPGA